MNQDTEHATMVKEAVENLNKVVMDAARTGLEVELEFQDGRIVFLSGVSTPQLKYHVSRTIKRG